ERFRSPRRAADASGAARLARDATGGGRLVDALARAAHRVVVDVSTKQWRERGRALRAPRATPIDGGRAARRDSLGGRRVGHLSRWRAPFPEAQRLEVDATQSLPRALRARPSQPLPDG